MIMRYGMSDKLGPRVLGRNHDMPFLGREMGAEPDYSEEIAREIDDEIKRVIEEAHGLAISVLKEHLDELHKISSILIERETIDKDQFERLLAGAAEDEVFVEEEQPAPPSEPEEERRRQQRPKPRPFPLPGATMQPPPPEGAKG
jgi:cell division protease FtsH